jgi:hypothetical protein
MGRIGDERLPRPRAAAIGRHLPASGASIGGGARRVSLRELRACMIESMNSTEIVATGR